MMNQLSTMITFGIDPGTAIMGWGVVEERNNTMTMIACGVVRTPAGEAQSQRLLQLHTDLLALLQTYQPDAAAIEELFFSKNVTTALAVGQARGVALLALAQNSIPIFEYKPLVVKQAVAGYGGADKKQMQEMVRMTLRLQAVPKPDDAADALAIAICHTYSAPMLRRIAGS